MITSHHPIMTCQTFHVGGNTSRWDAVESNPGTDWDLGDAV